MGSLVTTRRLRAHRQIGHLTSQLTSPHNWIPGRRALCAAREMRPRIVHFDLPIIDPRQLGSRGPRKLSIVFQDGKVQVPSVRDSSDYVNTAHVLEVDGQREKSLAQFQCIRQSDGLE